MDNVFLDRTGGRLLDKNQAAAKERQRNKQRRRSSIERKLKTTATASSTTLPQRPHPLVTVMPSFFSDTKGPELAANAAEASAFALIAGRNLYRACDLQEVAEREVAELERLLGTKRQEVSQAAQNVERMKDAYLDSVRRALVAVHMMAKEAGLDSRDIIFSPPASVKPSSPSTSSASPASSASASPLLSDGGDCGDSAHTQLHNVTGVSSSDDASPQASLLSLTAGRSRLSSISSSALALNSRNSSLSDPFGVGPSSLSTKHILERGPKDPAEYSPTSTPIPPVHIQTKYGLKTADETVQRSTPTAPVPPSSSTRQAQASLAASNVMPAKRSMPQLRSDSSATVAPSQSASLSRSTETPRVPTVLEALTTHLLSMEKSNSESSPAKALPEVPATDRLAPNRARATSVSSSTAPSSTRMTPSKSDDGSASVSSFGSGSVETRYVGGAGEVEMETETATIQAVVRREDKRGFARAMSVAIPSSASASASAPAPAPSSVTRPRPRMAGSPVPEESDAELEAEKDRATSDSSTVASSSNISPAIVSPTSEDKTRSTKKSNPSFASVPPSPPPSASQTSLPLPSSGATTAEGALRLSTGPRVRSSSNPAVQLKGAISSHAARERETGPLPPLSPLSPARSETDTAGTSRKTTMTATAATTATTRLGSSVKAMLGGGGERDGQGSMRSKLTSRPSIKKSRAGRPVLQARVLVGTESGTVIRPSAEDEDDGTCDIQLDSNAMDDPSSTGPASKPTPESPRILRSVRYSALKLLAPDTAGGQACVVLEGPRRGLVGVLKSVATVPDARQRDPLCWVWDPQSSQLFCIPFLHLARA